MFTFRVFLYTLLAMCSFGVHAVQTNLSMTGNISTVCSFGAPTPGTLALNPNAPNTMGTAVAGGNAASVTAYYVGTPTITVSKVTQFDSSPTLPTAITFTNAASTTNAGGLTFSGNTATYQETNGSSDTITLGLTATTANSAAFNTGTYTASSVVTCQ